MNAPTLVPDKKDAPSEKKDKDQKPVTASTPTPAPVSAAPAAEDVKQKTVNNLAAPKPAAKLTVEAILEALEELSGANLLEIINAAEDIRTERREEGLAALRERTRKEAEILGVDLDDLFPHLRRPSSAPLVRGRGLGIDAKQPLPPKFIGPNGETWSGRGRTPTWFLELKNKGERMENYLANKS